MRCVRDFLGFGHAFIWMQIRNEFMGLGGVTCHRCCCAIDPYVIDGRVENSGGFNGEGRALRIIEVTVDDVRDLSTISAIDITLLSIADRPEGNELSVSDLMVERPADS